MRNAYVAGQGGRAGQDPLQRSRIAPGEKNVCVITDVHVSDEARAELAAAGVELVCAEQAASFWNALYASDPLSTLIRSA